MSEKINLIRIESDPEARTITLITNTKFEYTFEVLESSIKFEPYKNPSENTLHPTVVNFVFEEQEDLPFPFIDDIDLEFVKHPFKPYSVLLNESGTKNTKEIYSIKTGFKVGYIPK